MRYSVLCVCLAVGCLAVGAVSQEPSPSEWERRGPVQFVAPVKGERVFIAEVRQFPRDTGSFHQRIVAEWENDKWNPGRDLPTGAPIPAYLRELKPLTKQTPRKLTSEEFQDVIDELREAVKKASRQVGDDPKGQKALRTHVEFLTDELPPGPSF